MAFGFPRRRTKPGRRAPRRKGPCAHRRRLRIEALEPRLVLHPGPIVINELHVNPDVKTEPVEYIELYNNSGSAVDLSNWYFSDGVQYTIPNGTTLQPWSYLVVSQNPAAVQAKFGVGSIGPWTGSLDNGGEKIVLRNAAGVVQDTVDYGLGFPWPTVGDAPGFSMELINPNFDNDLGGNWRSSQGSLRPPQVLFDFGAEWTYFKGTAEPSPYPLGAWRQLGFDDAAWLVGATGIGYPTPGDSGEAAMIATLLSDMNGNYSTVYLRKTFQIADPGAVDSLKLEAWYDDGINVWINGRWQPINANVTAENTPYTGTARSAIEYETAIPFTLTDLSGCLVAGTNVIAVQLFNSSKSGSSDAYFNAKLTTLSGGNPGATPGARNSVYAANAPPQTRQIDHAPNTPYAGQDVTIAIKATDPQGVAAVTLSYQLVNPGDYIAIDDSRYNNAAYWTNVAMYDDGTHGDATAGDNVYTAVIPGALQTHRRLVRYRVTAVDGLGASVTVPYADDPQPNFAYYVYNGVPDYTAAVQPGVTAPATYPGTMLDDIAVFQLITARTAHEQSQYIPNSTAGKYLGEDYPWKGTLVYDGAVYDHVSFRARGGVWRYAMGKNMWKFDFNRGHEFQARDNYGNKYDTKWTKLNLGANIQQGNYWNRGEQGLYESVGFGLFNLVGVAAPNTSFVHFRIVESANEFGTSQYTTDFQGLYLAVEQPDGRLLDEHGLPDGNLYKMEGGTGTLNNQGPTQPSDKSDLDAFLAAIGQPQTDQWWRDNFDLEGYYNYRAVVEAIHHGDIGYGKNYFYYHNPVTGKWQVLPWDLDLTWAETMYGNGNEPFKSLVLSRPAFKLEYENRLREILDLLYNAEQTGMLIDEKAGWIYDPAAPSMVGADRAMWDYNPIMASSYVDSSKAGQGRFYAGGSGNPVPAPGGFPGMVQKMKNYITFARTQTRNWAGTSGPSMEALANDALVPYTTSLSYVGQAGYPLDRLTFRTSSYASPGGTPFAAMQWRIAAVTDPAAPGFDPAQPRKYEIDATWQSDELTVFNDTLTVPSGNLAVGETYRVRVRMKDAAGRWSHWSAPIQFTATAPVEPLTNHLRIAELMYNPSAPSAAEIAAGYNERNMFEYIELINTYAAPLTLTGVQFTAGVTYTFSATTLDPGQRILVVSNPAAFAFRYGAGLNVAAGSFTGKLDDSGEAIRLVGPSPHLAVIHEFTYSDSGDWPGRADGKGSSLEIVDTAGDYNNPKNWRSSSEYDGSPGAAGVGPIFTVVVNEVLTHTNLPQLDYVELYNATPLPIEIGGWYLSDDNGNYRKFRIPDGTLLGGQQYRVYTEEDYGISAYAMASEGGDGIARTEDGGATLHLTGNTWRKIALQYDVTANTILEFDFRSTVQGEIQGVGFDDDDAASPGYFFKLYGTQAWGNAAYADYASSAPDWKHYAIPVGAFFTGAMQYLTLVNDDDAHDAAESWFRNVKVHEGTPGAAVDFSTYFGLSAFTGDDLWLVAADADGRLTYFIDRVEFGAADNGEAFGRWLNGSGGLTPMLSPTPGEANSGPRINPVVFTEIMYAPPPPGGSAVADDLEFVELYNATGSSIALGGWRLRGGIDYDFAAGTTLAAGGKIVVISFNLHNPANAQRWNDFCAAYGLNPADKSGFVGGYSGRLNDDSGSVRLERPGDPPRDDPTFTPYYLVEEVRYNSAAPWPAEPAGGGPSLARKAAILWSNDPASWTAAAASPLAFAPVVEYAAVAGRHVFYNRSAFNGGDPAANAADDAAIAIDKQALLPGGVADFANYTSYTRGINGLMVDIAGLWNAAGLTTADFAFKVGNDANPAGWTAAPAPLSVTVRAGAGSDGSDRVTLVWADNAVQQQWLQVTVRATANTGLAADDVFYFGNAIGETGFDGDPDPDAATATVDAEDELAVRNNKTGFAPTGIANVYDFNRDRRVGIGDELTARYLATTVETALRLIDLSGGGGAALLAMAAPLPETPNAADLGATAVPAAPQTEPPPSVIVVPAVPAATRVPIRAISADRVFASAPADDRIPPWSVHWYWLGEFEQLSRKPAGKKDAWLVLSTPAT